MEEDCNAVMRGIGSLPLLFHLRFWPHSSHSRNVCRWVDRYLGRGFWQCEPKPPSLARDHPSTARGPRHSSPSENWRDPRRVSSRFFFRRAQISINLGKQSSRNGRVAGPISSTTDLIPRTRVYGRGFELFWRRLDNLDGS